MNREPIKGWTPQEGVVAYGAVISDRGNAIVKRRTIQVSPWGAAALTLERRQVGFGELSRAVHGSEFIVQGPAAANPESRSMNPEPSTINPQASTLNHELQTLNPEP